MLNLKCDTQSINKIKGKNCLPIYINMYKDMEQVYNINYKHPFYTLTVTVNLQVKCHQINEQENIATFKLAYAPQFK